ncbi:UDP-N-acetylglucosamine 2-epimerase, partial [Mordavella massiliensis]|uniref:UDP-N-acetylglucosamine 2-epimerase n=1 Tax=Mordavella massiliensis TaxID=1871024 RepID=UPI00210DC848|nr:UDP-N-acetylglucosamine 2-epimerase [Mordavella massiliensis]
AARHPDVEVVYPVHLSPKVQQAAQAVFKDEPRVHLIAPLDVVDFHNLAARSYLIMTDSGGVQEEAPSLNKPVLRDETERPEGVKAVAQSQTVTRGLRRKRKSKQFASGLSKSQLKKSNLLFRLRRPHPGLWMRSFNML